MNIHVGVEYVTFYTISVDVMFRALSDCQILHPDPQEEEGNTWEVSTLNVVIICGYNLLKVEEMSTYVLMSIFIYFGQNPKQTTSYVS